jgi:serine/threonine protein kinase
METHARMYGRSLDGRFTTLEPLGTGATGTVYRGIQHPLGREVAIKVLHPVLAEGSPDQVRRFLREARLAGRIAHPNVMAVLDMGQTSDGLLYLVAEYLEGRTLADALRHELSFAPARTVRIGLQLAAALAAAHEHKIIHRDLKPSNVMLLDDEPDAVRVLDFGVAKSFAALQRGTGITELRAVVGTPAYMAPEVACAHPSDTRADLYSLGVVLYEMVAGRLPFPGKTVAAVLAQQILEPPPPLIGTCPGPLGTLIMDLLAKDPAQRPPSALHVHAALSELDGPGTITRPWQRHASSR